MPADKPLHLKRPVYEMPADIRAALEQAGLMPAYHARPPYQQNDYVGWITRAKTEPTRLKRLNQMLEELKGGTKYMNMTWRLKQ
jgi:uncharacterized protein YdeI (YjbR/CyaY-like superfamily)